MATMEVLTPTVPGGAVAMIRDHYDPMQLLDFVSTVLVESRVSPG